MDKLGEQEQNLKSATDEASIDEDHQEAAPEEQIELSETLQDKVTVGQQHSPTASRASSPALITIIALLFAILILLIVGYFNLTKRSKQIEADISSLQQTLPGLPQATIDAIIALQNGQAQTAQPQAENSTQQIGQTQASIDNDALLGDRSTARLAIIEFSDFNCPFCARFHAETLEQILDKYVRTGQAIYVYRDYVGVGQNMTLEAGSAAECVRAQAGDQIYLELVQSLYASSGRKNQALVRTFAEQKVLDTVQLETCIEASTYREEVLDDTRAGQAAGARGTPAFIIGLLDEEGMVTGVNIPGAQPFEVFDQTIQQQLALLD